jgi:hypothetical protein
MTDPSATAMNSNTGYAEKCQEIAGAWATVIEP